MMLRYVQLKEISTGEPYSTGVLFLTKEELISYALKDEVPDGIRLHKWLVVDDVLYHVAREGSKMGRISKSSRYVYSRDYTYRGYKKYMRGS